MHACYAVFEDGEFADRDALEPKHFRKWVEFAKKNGAILVTGGGLAMYPSADYLPLSMDKAALRAMVQALHPVMQGRGIFLGILTVCNVITEGSTCAPDILAEKYWEQYNYRKDWEVVCQ